MIVLYNQALALCIYLLRESSFDTALIGIYSIYVQAVSLSTFTILCALRGQLNRLASPLTEISCILVMLIAFSLVEGILYWAAGAAYSQSLDAQRFLRIGGVVLIIAMVMVRVMYLFDTLEQRNRAEAESRMQALQSRIRPHFLFNSLNTIAELTVTQPREAELAVNALSLLFRASLETETKFHSIASEIRLCQKYIDLERWRLGDRLAVQQEVVVADSGDWQIPKLILQPLVENAIVHGVQENGKIDIDIDIRETKQHLSLMVKNVKGVGEKLTEGHGIAVDNIRERLFILYDDQQSFRVRDNKEIYQIIMRIPKQRWHKIG
ncbi:MAG: histidine kinase [Gammaproteobacteria bacterium]|nr:histidine kinase [Gammaproteobacteria bacterium]